MDNTAGPARLSTQLRSNYGARLSLLLDDREDSALRRALAGYDVDLTVCRLEYGDACFEGCGPRGPLMCGVERKHIPDLVNSMTDRRLTGFQLAGMSRLYDVIYLVIEDYWRPTSMGGVELWKGRGWRPLYGHSGGVNFRQLDSFLQSLSFTMGVVVLRSGTTAETAALYAARYSWWQKSWRDHHTHEMIWAPAPGAQLHRGRALFAPEPGLVERCAALLPGIDRRAWDVGKRFHSVVDMVRATEKEWREIPGIGRETAHKAYRALRNSSDELVSSHDTINSGDD